MTLCNKPNIKPVSAGPLPRVQRLGPHGYQTEMNPLRMQYMPLTLLCVLSSQIFYPIRDAGKMTVQDDKDVENTFMDPEDKWHERAKQLKVTR